jgi:lipid-binding SYLF domain-containing protein
MKGSWKRRGHILDWAPWLAVLGCMVGGPRIPVAAAQHASAGQHPKSTTQLTPKLRAAAHVLAAISASNQNGIPDSVLNRTKCLVVIPSISNGTGNPSSIGVSICRDTPAEWSAPALVQFDGRGIKAKRPNLLVFILGEKGAEALRSGEFEIKGGRPGAAPLVKAGRVTASTEPDAELLTYQHSGGMLSGSEAYGVIRRYADTSSTHAKQITNKMSDQYRSAVVSFFNTILPIGIVFHHTAVIPGEKKAPRKESDIDEYHRERGFEIRCSGRVYHVAYHYLIMSNGVVKAGRPERCEGAHAVGYNSYLGISVIGDFSSEDNPTAKKSPIKPSARQIASLVRLCRRLRYRYNIPLQHIVRHSDIANTQCPGDRFPYRLILSQLQRKPSG